MIPTQLTDRIYNVVHLPERHPVHLLIQIIEISLYLLVVIRIILVVALVEHGQDGFSISEVWRMFCDIG